MSVSPNQYKNKYEQNLRNNMDQLKKTVGLDFLHGIQVGLEREGLRINPDGRLNQEPHSPLLGSAMMNASITTDFAENLLEFVTQPHNNVIDTLNELDKITHFTLYKLQNQRIWPASMPAKIQNENDIPIGQYGHSNQGKIKHLYRKGLSLRYGKMMQAIAGIHYNFSLTPQAMTAYFTAFNLNHSSNSTTVTDHDTAALQAFQSERYLNLARNVNRFGFIIPYLFGASPAVSKCFFKDAPSFLTPINHEDLGLPFATSLRLSDIGYSNTKCQFFVSSNSLENYIRDLNKAIITPCPDFTKLGVIKDGEHLQLNDHILQIENEYYTSIRPKQVLQGDERPLCALKKRGILYVELRSLDVNPFVGVGVDLNTMHFIQAFLTLCLLLDADPLGRDEAKICAQNLKKVAQTGRDLKTKITLFDNELDLDHAMHFVLNLIKPIAAELGTEYERALEDAITKVNDPNLTPSAQVLHAMQSYNQTHHEMMNALALKHTEMYLKIKPDHKDLHHYDTQAKVSLQKQHEIESLPQINFEVYLQNYLKKVCD